MSMTMLDQNQVIRTAFDEATGALKTIPATATSMQIELDAADGDNVGVQGNVLSPSTANITSASSGEIIAPISIVGMKSLQLYVQATSAITGPQSIVVEISPADTGSVWFATALAVTTPTSSGTVAAGTVLSAVARRVRVTQATPISSGTATIHLLAQGN